MQHQTKDDDFHPVCEATLKTDIIVAGSATPDLMALLDRAGYVSRANGNFFSRKSGGPIAGARRAGHNLTHAEPLRWFDETSPSRGFPRCSIPPCLPLAFP